MESTNVNLAAAAAECPSQAASLVGRAWQRAANLLQGPNGLAAPGAVLKEEVQAVQAVSWAARAWQLAADVLKRPYGLVAPWVHAGPEWQLGLSSFLRHLTLVLVTDVAGPLLLLLYPLMESVKAMEHPTPEATQQWITYWILYASVSFMEYAAAAVTKWVPLYPLLKLLFFAWLLLPEVHGASFLYRQIVKQGLVPSTRVRKREEGPLVSEEESEETHLLSDEQREKERKANRVREEAREMRRKEREGEGAWAGVSKETQNEVEQFVRFLGADEVHRVLSTAINRLPAQSREGYTPHPQYTHAFAAKLNLPLSVEPMKESGSGHGGRQGQAAGAPEENTGIRRTSGVVGKSAEEDNSLREGELPGMGKEEGMSGSAKRHTEGDTDKISASAASAIDGTARPDSQRTGVGKFSPTFPPEMYQDG